MLRILAPAAAALLGMAIAPAASAQLAIASAKPAVNSNVSKVTSVSMQFNKRVTPASVRAELIMTAMPGMSNHPPMKISITSAMTRDGKTLTITPKRVLVPGTYKVSWNATATDGQAMAGNYSFTAR